MAKNEINRDVDIFYVTHYAASKGIVKCHAQYVNHPPKMGRIWVIPTPVSMKRGTFITGEFSLNLHDAKQDALRRIDKEIEKMEVKLDKLRMVKQVTEDGGVLDVTGWQKYNDRSGLLPVPERNKD